MVAGDGPGCSSAEWQRGVKFFDGFFLRGEIAVDRIFVGVFEMDEKEAALSYSARVALELLRLAFDFTMPTSCARPLYIG